MTSLDEMADAVAGDVGFIIDSAVEARGDALIAVPGGKTGPAIMAKLAAKKLPWKRVTIIPTDDRLVRGRQRAGQCPRAGRDVPAARRPGGPADQRRRGGLSRCRAVPPTRGCRISAGRPTSSGWAWARTGTPLRSSPARDLAGRARCAQGPPGDRGDARSAARGCAGGPGDPDPRRDPERARPSSSPITGEDKRDLARAGDRRRAQLAAADRPRAGRGRAADRHPLVPLRTTRPRNCP